MSTIEVPRRIAAGKHVVLTLRGTSPQDCYITQNGVLLPYPLRLEPDIPVSYFPEAPGHYIIKGGCCEAELEVVEDIDLHSGPVRENGVWFPSAWEATLYRGYESETMLLLPELIRPGDVVYDLGANIGWYAMAFLRLGAGFVYCFEPNPVAMHYLSHNLAGAHNALILPLALADHNGMLNLSLNPDNLALGITAGVEHGITGALGANACVKQGITISVQGCRLDEAIARYGLRAPNLIKMDIEEGETLAIKGMLQTIEQHHPTLIFELHGYRAARAVLKYLDAYSWRVIGNERIYSAPELADEFPDACLQVIGVARVTEP